MELYEIVKVEIKERFVNGYLGKDIVITSTMNKDEAEQMLSIYKNTCASNEKYYIRTLVN